MKQISTLLFTVLFSVCAFAATEQAWYNDVTSIANNGQYYIYSVNGKGFMQGGQAQVKSITTSNYTSASTFKFTIANPSEGTVKSGNYYLKCYREVSGTTSGPINTKTENGTNIIFTSMNNGEYWNIHGHYNVFGERYPALYYKNGEYNAYLSGSGLIWSTTKDLQTATEYRWYVVSQAQLDRHFAIYLFDVYKETLDVSQYSGKVPAAYYTALNSAYNQTFSVQNTAHTANVVNAAKAELESLYNGAAALVEPYATAKAAINTLDAVEDKGEDFAEVTTDINNANTALEAAMTVEAINASVAGLKAIDPITFSVTEFTAISSIEGAAASQSGRAITYEAVDKSIINNGKALYKGTTTLTATAAATSDYYKFVRSAQVTVTAPTTYGDFVATTCDEPVEFFGKKYTETTKEDVNVGLNFMGGDSIVHVNIVINHATTGEESITIVYGEDKTWNGIALKDSTVGVHTVVYVTKNIAGCDSTVTLTLTVNKQETVEVPVDLAICTGDTVEYRGVEYTKEGTFNVQAEGAVRDTLYIVKVKENPVYSFSETGTAKVGEGYTWHETTYETSATGTFNYELPFRSIYGCDSIYHLTLTVTKADREEIPVELVFCEGDSAEYRGVVYTKEGLYPVYAEGAVRDTIYNVQVTVNQPSETFEEMTIVYGAEEEWNGVALKDSTVGVHTVVYTTTNIAGCDSVVTLALTVQKMDVLTLEQTLEFCEGDTVAYRDVAYYEAGVDTIEISGEVRDTMIVVTVTVWEKTYAEILVTDTVGNTIELPEGEWLLGEEVVSGTYELQEADTMGLEFVQYGETAHGCEAVTKLIVTVEERPMSEGIEDVFAEQAAKKFFRNGAIYIRRQDMLFGIDGKRVE